MKSTKLLNTSVDDLSIEITPFKALYRYKPLSFIDTVLGDSREPRVRDWLQEGQDMLSYLKENLQWTQNQEKMYIERHKIERSFEVGDLVYLWLQPYW